MTALAKDRNTFRRSTGPQKAYPVAASTKIYAGSLVCLDTAGHAVPAANTAGFRCVGVASGQADNSAGLAAAINVIVDEGQFKLANDGLVLADTGNPCYVLDDQTVSDRGTAGVVAGILSQVETDGVWVDIDSGRNESLEAGIETVTAGAVSVDTRTTLISVTGTQAYTLADGRYHGQRKSLKCSVAASTPVGTLTPATPSGFATILFDAVHEAAELEWRLGVGWILLMASGATPS